jgi:hypothetical protein
VSRNLLDRGAERRGPWRATARGVRAFGAVTPALGRLLAVWRGSRTRSADAHALERWSTGALSMRCGSAWHDASSRRARDPSRLEARRPLAQAAGARATGLRSRCTSPLTPVPRGPTRVVGVGTGLRELPEPRREAEPPGRRPGRIDPA